MQSQFKVSLFSVDGKSSSDCALKVAFFGDKLSKWVELYKCAGDTVSSFVATSDCYNIQGKLPKEHEDLERFLCHFMAEHEKKPEAYVSSGVVINDRLYLTFIQPGIYNVLEFTIVDKDPLNHLVNKLKDALADKGISQKTYFTEVNEVQKTESLPVLDDSKISCQNTEYFKVISTEANNGMPKHISPSDATFTELHLVSKVEPTKQGNVTEHQVYEDLTQAFYDKVAESALNTDLPKNNTLHESQAEPVKDKAEVTSPRSTKPKISAKSANEDQVNKLPDIGSFSIGGWDDEVPETHMPKPTQVQQSQFSGRGRGSFNDYSSVSRGGYNQRGESNYNRPQKDYNQGKTYGQYNQDIGRGRGGFGGPRNAAPYGNPQYGSYNQQQNYEDGYGNKQQDNARGRGGSYGATIGGYGGGRGGYRGARNPADGNW